MQDWQEALKCYIEKIDEIRLIEMRIRNENLFSHRRRRFIALTS